MAAKPPFPRLQFLECNVPSPISFSKMARLILLPFCRSSDFLKLDLSTVPAGTPHYVKLIGLPPKIDPEVGEDMITISVAYLDAIADEIVVGEEAIITVHAATTSARSRRAPAQGALSTLAVRIVQSDGQGPQNIPDTASLVSIQSSASESVSNFAPALLLYLVLSAHLRCCSSASSRMPRLYCRVTTFSVQAACPSTHGHSTAVALRSQSRGTPVSIWSRPRAAASAPARVLAPWK